MEFCEAFSCVSDHAMVRQTEFSFLKLKVFDRIKYFLNKVVHEYTDCIF